MKKTFSSSQKKVLLITLVIFSVIFIIFNVFVGKYEKTGLVLGVAFGLVFAMFPLFYGLGQKIEVTDKEFIYSSNILVLFFSRLKKKLLISEIIEIRLGVPKFNKGLNTFAAINISTQKEEISFNPDLFDSTTMQNLILTLKLKNPHLKLDNYANSLMEQGKDGGLFRRILFKEFMD